MEEIATDAGGIAKSALVDAWRNANDYYGELEAVEAGIADEVDIRELDPAMRALADEVMADPRYQRAFDCLPTRFAMVELDHLLVGHPYISKQHTDRQSAKLGPAPSLEALFHFCHPLDRKEAPVEVRKTGPRTYTFWSPSSDFRFQETVLLLPGQIANYEPFGPLGGAVAMMVGYGSNFLSLIESGSRFLRASPFEGLVIGQQSFAQL